MQFTYQQIVDRAKVWIDDDHDDVKGWIKDDKWLTIVFAEYRRLYRELIRRGVLAVPWTAEQFTITSPASTTVPGSYQLAGDVVAILGVAEVVSGGAYYRPLVAAQSAFGGAGLWQGTQQSGKPVYWYAGLDTSANIPDEPFIWFDKPDVGALYEVRYIPAVTAPVSLASNLQLWMDLDELLVCRVAAAAHTKDNTSSAALEKRLTREEQELAFKAFGATGESPRVRRVRPKERHTISPFPVSPRDWVYR